MAQTKISQIYTYIYIYIYLCLYLGGHKGALKRIFSGSCNVSYVGKGYWISFVEWYFSASKPYHHVLKTVSKDEQS